MGRYSILIRTEILTCATMWMNLEDSKLNKISQTQKDRYRTSLLMRGYRVVKLIEKKV